MAEQEEDKMTIKEFREAREMLENPQGHPDHYNQGKIECIDAMESAFGKDAVFDFCLLNAFKYLWRCREKGSMSADLQKARWYITKAEEIANEADSD